MKAIILAAGYATRLYPLTLNKPKPLLEIKGKPLLSYIIQKINKIKDVNEIFIVTNNKFYSQFVLWKEHFKNLNQKIEIINDNTQSNEKRLGGIGDLNFVINKKDIQDDLLVILGDNFFAFNLDEFVDFFNQTKKTMIGLVEISKEKAKRFGVIELDTEGKIIGFEEKPSEPKSNLISTGIYIFTKEDLEKIREYMKTDLNKDGPGYLVKYLIEKNDVYAYKFKGGWVDIGSMEEYEKLR